MSPPLAVLATLLLVLLMPRRVPLWASFLGACLLLPFLAGQGIDGSWRLWTAAARDPGTWTFVRLCAGVFVLSSILTHGGHLGALCDFASALIPSRRLRAAVMPAVVGLVPMPGGAVVSAPLMDRALGGAEVPPIDKNLVNYWFRHIWEISWPLYPAVLLALRHVGEGDVRFFAVQGTLTVLLAAAGFASLLRRIPGTPAGGRAPMPPLANARAAVPLAALIAVPLVRWPGRDAGGPFLDAGIAVLAAIVLAIATALDPRGLARVPRDRRIFAMTALAFLVKVFGDLVRDAGGAQGILGSGTPLWVFVLAAPFFVGFATGATLTFATVTFPVIDQLAGQGDLVPWLVLAYAAGFAGYLTSPVHMCLVLSSRYFDSRLPAAYGRLAPPLLVFLAAAIGLFLLLGGRFDT